MRRMFGLKENKMKKWIIIAIFGIILTLSFEVKAYNNSYTEWQQEVIDLLEDIRDNGDDISSDVETILDRL